ncbi:glutamate--tRNA ligase [Striga asiatica]|uniref:Glutamate--tRNA ligase n=1 Tax=Striga asiatica TaxID=4170 RepID=A0A5A7R695_STRAF|nr:glutamate--tRNA ligase [Striga asiatica]
MPRDSIASSTFRWRNFLSPDRNPPLSSSSSSSSRSSSFFLVLSPICSLASSIRPPLWQESDTMRGKRWLTGDEIHIRGDNALVVAGVVVLAGLRWEAGAVAAVVDEQEVAAPGRINQIGKCSTDVAARGLGAGLVCVDEYRDVVRRETVALDEAAVHSLDIVDATSQLRLCPRVIASDQHRPSCHGFFDERQKL